MNILKVFLVKVLIFYTHSGHAQGTVEDYGRAALVKSKMENKVYYSPKTFTWLQNGAAIWYMIATPKGREFILADINLKERRPAFDQAKLAKSLSAITNRKISPYDLPFTEFSFAEKETKIEFVAEGSIWQADLTSYIITEKGKALASPGNEGRRSAILNTEPIKSPDGKWLAFIKNYNVYVRPVSTVNEESALSFDGSEGDYYSSGDVVWSPDSKKIFTFRIRANKPHPVYLIESSPTDQLQPKLHTRNYLKPGDALPVKIPSIFVLESKLHFSVDESLIKEHYNIANPAWRKDSRSVSFEYNKRGHQVYKIMELEATTGKVYTLVAEDCKTFFDYNGKKFRYDIEDGKEILWTSERDGWNHLYLFDAVTGKIKNQVTRGEWVVRRVIKVDETKRNIIFEASGKNPAQDPYFIQYYKINFDGTGLVPLTTENGNHTAFFSPDFSHFADVWSRVDEPPVSVLRNAADGSIIMKLEQADIKSLISAGWRLPEVFNAKGRDGITDIWGIIVRPVNFDPRKKYPVIEYIYAGPHNSFVPKSFIADPKSGDYRSLSAFHELAELGFIVVQIDGMGTSNRSKAFHDISWKNLKDGGFPDRILWMQAAAAKYPYMDLKNVGIYGNSAGGQNSMAALLFHPDFYKVAVSSSGCHDNRMDKIWWNELWMGYPIGPQYEASSNVTHAAKLKGKLLLILGEMDENVPPESTLQLVNALIRANKNFDFLIVPGMGHSMGGDYGEHKRRDFFVKHLLGVEPPGW